MRPRTASRYLPPILLGALAVMLALTGCSRLALPEVFSGVIDPSITPATDQQGLHVAERDFDFEDTRVRLSVSIDRAVYVGAQRAEKSTVFIGRSQPADWIDGHYRSFVDEEHQEPFYQALLASLHEVRRQKGLDSARYVELVTSMAQTMEYRVDPVSLAPKFPIETVGDGYGDCDDKALLAAAVLAGDGYDVAILFFEPEKHVALGIRAPGLDFKGTGYAYIEMTQPSLVGIVPEKLAGDVVLESQPVVVRIGSGEQAYDAGEQIRYIEKRLADVRTATERLGKQITARNTELDALRTSLESSKQQAQSTSDPTAAAAAVERHNRLVNEHNALVASLNALVAQHNALVEAQRYVAEHQTARPQIYDRLRGLRL